MHSQTTQYNTLQHTATHCNTLQHTATHCNTLQHTISHCNTLQHTATRLQGPAIDLNALTNDDYTHCNTLQHTATRLQGQAIDVDALTNNDDWGKAVGGFFNQLSLGGLFSSGGSEEGVLQCVAACCSVLQRVAVCCSVLRCAAVCCSVLQCVGWLYRVAKTHRMPYLYKSFSAKEPYN